MKKQVKVFYSGKVQGVGFRFTAQNLADELEIVGWTKNLPDGRVELCAEAEELVLKDFLDRINAVFTRYIQSIDVNWLGESGEFREFSIKY